MTTAATSGSPNSANSDGVRIVPSMLGADQSRLAEGLATATAAGADRVQWDVMDGHFVPNLTIGPGVIAAAHETATIPFEAHLMVDNPDRLLASYVEAGCELVIVHAETCAHLHRTLGAIRELGARAGVALNPATPVSAVEHVVDQLDLVLVMTVNPGFAGQPYLRSMEPKIAAVRALLDDAGSTAELEVDGGIGPDTIAGAAGAGADTFCAGSAVFGADMPPAGAIRDLRGRAAAAMVGGSGGAAGTREAAGTSAGGRSSPREIQLPDVTHRVMRA